MNCHPSGLIHTEFTNNLRFAASLTIDKVEKRFVMKKDKWNMALQRNVILNDTYQVRQVLTSSELAIVYAGRNRHTGAKVAIKEFSPSIGCVRRINVRFLRNTWIWRAISGAAVSISAGGRAAVFA